MTVKAWIIKEEGFDKEDITKNGNKFLIGNGYAGVRGTLDEFGKEELAAVNLSGIYDQYGDKFREPLNAPNPFYTCVSVDGIRYGLPRKQPKEHTISLDYRHGVFMRQTVFNTVKGELTISSERFASMSEPHFFYSKFNVKSNCDCTIELDTGIDCEIWEINGPHYEKFKTGQDQAGMKCLAVTQEKKEQVCVRAALTYEFPAKEELVNEPKKLLTHLVIEAKADTEYTVYKLCSISTSKDVSLHTSNLDGSLLSGADVYQKAKEKQFLTWEELWKYSQVLITGDDSAMQALNYSLYHLHSIAPRHAKSMSIPARGLSGQTYKGAVFWDTEIFMLDFFLNTEPDTAKTLLRYRIDSLGGAQKKAKKYGLEGAFYAWESQEGGYDACSDYNVIDVFTKRPMRTYFKDKQIHISAAVVYGIIHYYESTQDLSIFSEGGAKTILECAQFYYSLLLKKAGKLQYELHDVIGPDEYHERVNNNGYTNRMAKFCFEQAVNILAMIPKLSKKCRMELSSEYPLELLADRYQKAKDLMYVPDPGENGVIEQFDGYFSLEDVSVQQVRDRLIDPKEYWGGAYGVASQTQVIKQADVITWLNLFPDDFDDSIVMKNYEYYEPRTEHGSSLSACMYAMTACRCAMPQIAYPLFLKSATADLTGGGKEWAGLLYIGGTHPAAEGGAYMTAIRGFAGVKMKNGVITATPHLPESVSGMTFYLCYEKKRYQVIIKKDQEPQITAIEETADPKS